MQTVARKLTEPIVPLAFLSFRGKRVVPASHFAESTKLEDKKAIHRSGVYKLLKGNPDVYLEGEHMFLYVAENHPEEYKEFRERYHHLLHLPWFTNVTHLITYEGILKACAYWKVNPETLVSEHEVLRNAPVQTPLIPTKDNSPFAGLVPIVHETVSTVKDIPAHLKRNYRMYVRNLKDANEKVLLGLNYQIANQLNDFPICLQEAQQDGAKRLWARVYVDTREEQTKVMMTFVPEGTEDSFLLSNTFKDGHFSNVSLRRNEKTRAVLEALLLAGINSTDTRNIELNVDYQTVVATFG